MLSALPRTASGHPGIGAVIYLVLVSVLVGSTIVAARRDRGGGRGGGGRGRSRGRRKRRPPHR